MKSIGNMISVSRLIDFWYDIESDKYDLSDNCFSIEYIILSNGSSSTWFNILMY